MPLPPRADHILAPIQTLAGGGVEKILLRLAGAWLDAGRRVTLAVGSGDGPLAGDVPQRAEVVALDDARYVALARVMPALVRERAPDLLFVPGNHYTSIAAYSRLRLGEAAPPIVAKMSNTFARRDLSRLARTGYAAWLRRHPRFLDALVAMTAGMRVEAIAATGLAAERVHVIANPLPRPGAVDAWPGRYLLGVGRLARQKRWDRAIAALAALGDGGVELIILGEGEERAALTALAASLGVGERVRLPGYLADPTAAIAGAAAVVLASDFEGVPGVLREALALGTPVVATAASVAIAEIVGDAAQGSVVPVGDGAALVAALAHWLAPDRARPPPIVTAGDAAADYLALFDSLVSSRKPA